ncbi:MAG: citryl-CoA lyase [Candidatus Magasanikbacteria bacterium]|nr:citryl-CoA lyase [Candidatus Magasanikbacteria bacterium]
MKWETAITNINKGQEVIRGKKLSGLIKSSTFTETIFLIWQGRMPKPAETKMLDALLVSAIDHGTGTASAMTARIVSSAKNSLHTSLAAGILAMGERHGSAIESAAKFFVENKNNKNLGQTVKDLKDKKVRLAGFGHAVLTKDERSIELLKMAKKLGFYKDCCLVAQNTEKELKKISSKPLPLNIDGAMGAILSDMGFDHKIMKGVFIAGRVPGLVAHIYEEMQNDAGLRRLSEDEITYVGK